MSLYECYGYSLPSSLLSRTVLNDARAILEASDGVSHGSL